MKFATLGIFSCVSAQDVAIMPRDIAQISAQCMSKQSQDVAGASYKRIYSSNADDCCEECSADPKCKVAVFVEGECKLKDSMKLINATSGFMTMFPSSPPLSKTATTTPMPWPAGDDVDVYVTTTDEVNLFERKASLELGAAPSSATVRVNLTEKYQSMVGFGAAITDASAYNLYTKDQALYREIMAELFGEDGLRINIVRTSIGVSDFSVSYAMGNQTYADVENDWDLSHFSTAYDDHWLLPVLRDARRLNPRLKIIATPWTPPKWLKTSGVGGALGSGSLLDTDQAYVTYANYFVKFLQDYEEKGVHVDYLTLQNEPFHWRCNTMPCCKVEASSEAKLLKVLGPLIEAAGLQTKILGYDHNWDRASYPRALLQDSLVNPYVAGTAWHCYGGDVSAQSKIYEDFPDKEVHMTECSGGTWTGSWEKTFLNNMQELFIGNANNFGQSTILWNMALDEDRGPRCQGGACCSTCRGIITVPSTATSMSDISRGVEFYNLAHFSKLVPEGSRRLGTTTSDGLLATAFLLPGESRIVLQVTNPNSDPAFLRVDVDGKGFAFSLPQGAASFAWDLATSKVVVVV